MVSPSHPSWPSHQARFDPPPRPARRLRGNRRPASRTRTRSCFDGQAPSEQKALQTKPNRPFKVLSFLQFRLVFLRRTDYDAQGWLEAGNDIAGAPCQWQLGPHYIDKRWPRADIAILAMSDYPPPDEDIRDVVSAAVFAEVDADHRAAYIPVVCSRKFASRHAPHKAIKLGLGVILLCELIQHLYKEAGVRDLYLHAGELKVISYYEHLGFQLSKHKCAATEAKTREQLLRDPTFERAGAGFSMRLCQLPLDPALTSICRRASEFQKRSLAVAEDLNYDFG